MNRQTARATIAALMTSAAELAADVAGNLSEAAAAGQDSRMAIGCAMRAEEQLAAVAHMLAAARALNRETP